MWLPSHLVLLRNRGRSSGDSEGRHPGPALSNPILAAEEGLASQCVCLDTCVPADAGWLAMELRGWGGASSTHHTLLRDLVCPSPGMHRGRREPSATSIASAELLRGLAAFRPLEDQSIVSRPLPFFYLGSLHGDLALPQRQEDTRPLNNCVCGCLFRFEYLFKD